MFKKIIVIISIIILTGCAVKEKIELTNYINKHLKEISKLEREVIINYENNKNSDNFYIVLSDEIIPKYDVIVDRITKIKLESKEIKKIHNLYVEASKLQSKAFYKLKEALYEKNNDKVKEANKYLNDSRIYMDNFKTELFKILDKHKVNY